MNKRRLSTILVLLGLADTASGQEKSVPYPYLPAKCSSDTLTVFPQAGNPITIPLPSRLACTGFSPDGKSLYAREALNMSAPNELLTASVVRIQFNPIRASPLPGSRGFGAYTNYAISMAEDKIVMPEYDPARHTCGIREVSLHTGAIRHLLENAGCDERFTWHGLSLSSDGDNAIATRSGHLEIINLVHETAKPIGDFESAAWSPDGRWIAAVRGRGKLVLIDLTNLSHRQLNHFCPLTPQWSPDSRYLLLWTYHSFRCGFSLDVETPATLQMLDLATGKKSTIRSSQCRIQGVTGWVTSEIVR